MATERTELFIPPEDIQRRVKELAERLSADLAGKCPLMLGILKGCFVFMSDLLRHMRLPVEVDFVRLASYGSGTESSGQVRMTKPPEAELGGRTVVVVEDIVDTGLTLSWLRERLKEMNPKELKFCVLLDKPSRRKVPFTPEYVGFSVPDEFLVGYGLDYNERYRELPGIYKLVME